MHVDDTRIIRLLEKLCLIGERTNTLLENLMSDAFDPIRKAMTDQSAAITDLVSAVNKLTAAGANGAIPQDLLDQAAAAVTAATAADAIAQSALGTVPPAPAPTDPNAPPTA